MQELWDAGAGHGLQLARAAAREVRTWSQQAYLIGFPPRLTFSSPLFAAALPLAHLIQNSCP